MKHNKGPKAPNAVTIFGAGIAGLTAAHELVERGFHVQVWECTPDQRHPERGCDAGGLARTQWGAIDWPTTRNLDGFGEESGTTFEHSDARQLNASWQARRAGYIAHIPHRFYIKWSPGRFTTAEIKRDKNGKFPRGDSFETFVQTLKALPAIDTLTGVTISAYGVRDLSPEERKRRAAVVLARAKPLLGWLNVTQDQAGLSFSFPRPPTSTGAADPRPPITIDVLDGANPDWIDIALEFESASGELTTSLFRRKWAPDADSLMPIEGGKFQDGVQDALKFLKDRPHVKHLYLEISARRLDELSGEALDARAAALVDLIKETANQLLDLSAHRPYMLTFPDPAGNVREVELIPVLVPALPFPTYETAAEGFEAVISFRAREHWLPGEHGYRFFPSFYHHVFDTMKRTPLLTAVAKPSYTQAQERTVGIRNPESVQYQETGRTAFDNVKPTSSHMLALASDQRPSQLSRSAVGSLEELREYLNVLFGDPGAGGLGLDPRDASRITLKILQFATSSEARRRSYEQMSWFDYLNAASYTQGTQDLLDSWPRALVAMSAEECDARTEGVPLMQLLLDQARPAAYRDGTLVGPTSEAWLKPWRQYLEAQGVEFIHGNLDGFYQTSVDGVEQVLPRVRCFDERYAMQTSVLRPGYFIVAVSADKVQKLAQDTATAAKGYPAEAPLARLANSEDFRRARGIQAKDFRQFSGIQFYFAEDVLWLDGHVYYPDSPWGLTSISQARFWQDRMDWEHGYRGILSVIIGDWTAKDEDDDPKAAEECEPAELARRVWEQIKSRIHGKRNRPGANVGRFARRTPDGPIPEPIAWQLDQTVVEAKSDEVTSEGSPRKLSSKSLMFIAQPARFEHRPGSLDGYRVTCGVVLAGHYTQTYTRLPCMEAANESARHAVNAIIRDIQDNETASPYRPGSFCDIWNPEDREIDDLQFLKDLDQKLFERDVPHLFEVVDADSLSAHLLTGDAKDPLDPLRLLSRLRRLMREAR